MRCAHPPISRWINFSLFFPFLSIIRLSTVSERIFSILLHNNTNQLLLRIKKAQLLEFLFFIFAQRSLFTRGRKMSYFLVVKRVAAISRLHCSNFPSMKAVKAELGDQVSHFVHYMHTRTANEDRRKRQIPLLYCSVFSIHHHIRYSCCFGLHFGSMGQIFRMFLAYIFQKWRSFIYQKWTRCRLVTRMQPQNFVTNGKW